MRIILILLIPIFISSCGSGSSESETEGISPEPVPVVNIDPHQVGTLAREIVHDNIIRRFILYVPDSYDRNTPTPLLFNFCLLYTSPSPRDSTLSRMPSAA